MVVPLLVAVPAFGIACLATFLLARPGSLLQILDHPNERSLHRTPIPRTGGLAIWAGALVGSVLAIGLLGVRMPLAWTAAALLSVGTISFIDDRFHIPAAARLAVHLAAGALLLLGGLGLQSVWLPGIKSELPAAVSLLSSMLFVVWMTNLYNFMDGMDGFASGMAVFGFGTLGLLGAIAGDMSFAMLCWVAAAAAAGFLVFNFPPARIFMGDTGASVLGILAAAFSLWADRVGLFPLWVSMLVFSPFIVDATVTLLRRAMQRERIWEAHRRHYYQRLVQLGWGHRKTVLAEYALMLLCAVSAVLGVQLSVPAQWAIILFWLGVYTCLILKVEQLDKQASVSNETRKQ